MFITCFELRSVDVGAGVVDVFVVVDDVLVVAVIVDVLIVLVVVVVMVTVDEVVVHASHSTGQESTS